MTQATEKSAMAKIYMRLLPFAILSYFLAYVDRINVSFAALTMRDDLQMSASAYGFALGTFYWAYFIFEVPSNIVMEKVGARLWIARIMITWGLLACALPMSPAQQASASYGSCWARPKLGSFRVSFCISPTGSRPTTMLGSCRDF
jgi:Sugar phosphate permease